jgi:superfamily II DNA/RNA helicase
MSLTFADLNLNKDISKAVALCGYTIPTPIQQQSIPVILEGKDIIASAQTGTGKTAAFVLPALHLLAQNQGHTAGKNPRVLVLTPTRELAIQILNAVRSYRGHLRLNVVSLVGGMPYHHQIKDLTRGADVVIATPGRLLDHMEQNRINLSKIEMLVLDEADRMLDMGFIEDVQTIAAETPDTRQTLLFSATVDKQLTDQIRHLLKNPVRIDLSEKKLAAPKIQQEFYRTPHIHHKNRLLRHLLNDGNIYKAIIFSATKHHADKLAGELRDEGMSADALHGDLRQNVRNRIVEKFRQGRIQYLVATDVAARGIDISDVTHVFNFDLPRQCEDYVHRIGRTGRAGKSGSAISFVLPAEFKHLQRIEKYVGQRFQLHHADLDDKSFRSSAASSEGTEQRKSNQSQQGDYLSRRDESFPRKSKSSHERRESTHRHAKADESRRGFESRQKKKTFKGSDAIAFNADEKNAETTKIRTAPRDEHKISYKKRNKPAYDDKKPSRYRNETRFGEKSTRGERPARDERYARSERPLRDEKRSSSSRGERRFDRDERKPRSFDKPRQSENRFRSDEKRSDRKENKGRFDHRKPKQDASSARVKKSHGFHSKFDEPRRKNRVEE